MSSLFEYSSPDTADLREIVEQGREFLEVWQDSEADSEDRAEAKAALEQLAELAAQLGYAGKAGTTLHYSETLDNLERYADDESTMVAAHYFKAYAQELAEDCDMIPANLSWPVRHIDWQAAADELRQDYSEVDFDGESWLIRSV